MCRIPVPPIVPGCIDESSGSGPDGIDESRRRPHGRPDGRTGIVAARPTRWPPATGSLEA